jgi:hypothetical protein
MPARRCAWWMCASHSSTARRTSGTPNSIPMRGVPQSIDSLRATDRAAGAVLPPWHAQPAGGGMAAQPGIPGLPEHGRRHRPLEPRNRSRGPALLLIFDVAPRHSVPDCTRCAPADCAVRHSSDLALGSCVFTNGFAYRQAVDYATAFQAGLRPPRMATLQSVGRHKSPGSHVKACIALFHVRNAIRSTTRQE